ncbi:putative diacetyl reductase [(R)-acetoin forming] [Paramyrothecium foliicola]|nr:putative diacetyl reductase [(R)-acetoin forming] [Paramyrothecium foliicola]
MQEAVKTVASVGSLSLVAEPQPTMKALRFHGQRDIRLDTIPAPKLAPGKVMITPKFCGICGTDLHEYMGGANLIPKPGKPHPITSETYPLTMGHEFSGIVEGVGEGVTHVKKGDRVCVQPILFDGDCRSCKRGLVNCCDRNGFIGLSGWGGGLSESAVVPEYSVKKLPDNVPLEIGALVEPLSVGWHSVDMSPFQEGDSALVLGGGPIGLAVVQVLHGRGCNNIIVSEVSSRRREFATEFGAHHTIDPTKEDIVERVKELTGGRGADVGFDAAGVQVALDTAFMALKARGTLVNIAVWENKAQLPMNELVFRERSYMGVATFSLGDFEAVIEAISQGKIKPAGMITKKIKLDQVEAEGFHTLINDKENHVKILVDVGAGLSEP